MEKIESGHRLLNIEVRSKKLEQIKIARIALKAKLGTGIPIIAEEEHMTTNEVEEMLKSYFGFTITNGKALYEKGEKEFDRTLMDLID